MVTKCPELFRCCLGERVYSSKLHGKTIKAVYPLKTLKCVTEKYSKLIASVLESVAKRKVKNLPGSMGIMTDLATLLGGQATFINLRQRH